MREKRGKEDKERKARREAFFFYLITIQIPAESRTGLIWTQKVGRRSRAPTWVWGSQSLLPPRVCTGRKLESGLEKGFHLLSSDTGTSVPCGVLATKAQHAVLTICFGGRRRSNEITMFLFVTRKSLILSISIRSSKSHWLCLLVSDLLMQRNERGTLLSVNCLTLETK